MGENERLSKDALLIAASVLLAATVVAYALMNQRTSVDVCYALAGKMANVEGQAENPRAVFSLAARLCSGAN